MRMYDKNFKLSICLNKEEEEKSICIIRKTANEENEKR